MRNELIIILVGVLLGIFIGMEKYPKDPPDKDIVYYEVVHYRNINNLQLEHDLIDVLYYYDIKYPEIVYAQAILETGYFKSNVCNNYNNIFGLYDSRNNDYFKFNHWTESVLAYKNMIQYKFEGAEEEPPNYYTFLEQIGYAEDVNYTNKLRKLVTKNYKLFYE